MRYIISLEKLNKNILIAQFLIGAKSLSLMFKEYYEEIYYQLNNNYNSDIFGINIPESICYAIGRATHHNKGAVVNNLTDVANLHFSGMRLFYIPIDTTDGREGMSVYEASQLARNIHNFVDSSITIMGLVTNGCINNNHIKKQEDWYDIWSAFDGHLKGVSVGGSFWLNKHNILPEFVNDVRIGRFMLFGIIPYSEDNIGQNCMTIEGNVLGVNLSNNKVIVDLGDAYCDPEQCKPNNDDFILSDISSNYALYYTPKASMYYIGQRLLFTPSYQHSSALSKLNVRFDYE